MWPNYFWFLFIYLNIYRGLVPFRLKMRLNKTLNGTRTLLRANHDIDNAPFEMVSYFMQVSSRITS